VRKRGFGEKDRVHFLRRRHMLVEGVSWRRGATKERVNLCVEKDATRKGAPVRKGWCTFVAHFSRQKAEKGHSYQEKEVYTSR
jgi:hypothetical protein